VGAPVLPRIKLGSESIFLDYPVSHVEVKSTLTPISHIISREGQEVFRDADYIPAHPGVAALVPTLKPKEGNFRAQFFTPEETEDGMPEWKKVSDELFR